MMPHNHQAPLVDLSMREPFPLVPVGDFQLEDNIFPGTPGDSLQNTSKELMKLQKMRFQVPMHRPAQTLAVCHEDETSQLSRSSGEVPSSTSKNGDPPKATASQAGSPPTTSTPHLERSTMDPVTKTHTVPHPNTGINITKTRKTASPHTNTQHLQSRGPPCGQKRSPTSKNLPWSSTPHPEAITSASQTSNSPSPA